MKTSNEDIKVVLAKNQLRLFGFEDYFNSVQYILIALQIFDHYMLFGVLLDFVI